MAKKAAETKKTAKAEKPQRERFIEFAKAHGADDPDAVDKAMGDIAKGIKSPSKG